MSVTHLTTTEGKDQFYPTPPELAAKMLEKVNGWHVSTILEPSAGKGDLILAFSKKRLDEYRDHSIYSKYRRSLDVDACEIDPYLREICKFNFSDQRADEYREPYSEYQRRSWSDLSGEEQADMRRLKRELDALKSVKLHMIHDDFLTLRTIKKYDLILMNPPFADGDLHLLKAMDIQKGGGQIVCLLNAETLRNPYTRTRQLLVEKLREYEAEIEYVEDAFSTAERTADVDVAIVNVTVPKPEREESTIWQRMKAAAEAEHVPDAELKALVPSGYIDQAISLYEAELAATMAFVKEYHAFVPYMQTGFEGTNSPALKLTYYDRVTGQEDREFDVNGYLKVLRMKYWNAMFHNQEFTARLTSNLRDKWQKEIDRLSDYDFTAFNIKQVMVEINASMQQGVEDTIMSLFDVLTYVYTWNPELNQNRLHFEGWKTNSAYKVGKKVILPTYGTYSEYSWDKGKGFRVDRAYDKLSDIEKAFDYLDGGKFEGKRIDIRPALKAASDGLQHRNVPCTYFLVDIFKKGTIHIKFRPEAMPLVERLNIYAAQGKAWLPPRAYKTPYNNLDAEEKAVMDSFGGDGTEGSGEKAYNEILKDPAYYLTSPGGGHMLMLTN